MDEFLDLQDLPKLNQDGVNNLNRPITSGKIKAIIKSTTIKTKIPWQDGFSTEFYKIFKEELMSLLCKLACKIEAEGTFRNPFLQSHLYIDTKTTQRPSNNHNSRPMNVDLEIINKIFASQIQEQVKKSTHHYQVFIPKMQRWFTTHKS